MGPFPAINMRPVQGEFRKVLFWFSLNGAHDFCYPTTILAIVAFLFYPWLLNQGVESVTNGDKEKNKPTPALSLLQIEITSSST